MQRYNGQLINQFATVINGNAAAGAQVTVRLKSTGATVTLYATDDIGGATLANPLTADAKGYYGFYAPDGVYTLDVSISGTPQLEIQLQDVAALQDQFNDALANAGYIPVGTFAAGCTVSQSNGVVSDGSSFWRWDGALPKAVTAGSEPTPTGAGNWILVSDEALRGDLAASNSSVVIGGVTASNLAGLYAQRNDAGRVYVIEQFASYMGGRGMLASETPSIVTESAITSAASIGGTSISIASTANFQVGARVVVYHSSVGKYEPYFVESKGSTTLGLATGLRYAVTTSCFVERMWYNQPHPGKFYMRMLAQKIAAAKMNNHCAPNFGRLYFSQFDSDPTDANDSSSAIGGATLAYIDQLNISQGDIAKPLESMIGRALFIEGSADGFGAELPLFKTFGVTSVAISANVMCRDPAVSVEIQLVDTDGFIQMAYEVPQESLRVSTQYKFQAKLGARTEQVKLRLVAVSGVTAAASLIVDQIEVFQSVEPSATVIDNKKPCVIVGLGDSWIAGDISQPERESILTQLAIELPNATIYNEGIGGQKVWEMYDRFDADVATHNPDYVIVNTGTNDSYSPISGTFFPNSVDQFERYYNLLLNKISAIGATAIIIGVPALAESDGSFTSWALNERAKTYNRYFWKRFSRVVGYQESIPVPANTSFTPVLKINSSTTGITYSARSGVYNRSGNVVTFALSMTLSSKGSSTGLVTIDMPPVSCATGFVYPFNTVAVNVSSAIGISAAGAIGASGEMRLQIPSAGGTAAATEANINNNTTLYISGSYLA